MSLFQLKPESFFQVRSNLYCIMSRPLMVKKLFGFDTQSPDSVVKSKSLAACSSKKRLYNFTATLFKNQALFVCGGRVDVFSKEAEKSCLKYDLWTNKWSKMPDLTWSCANFYGSCTMGDWLYVFHIDGVERLNVVD